MIHEESTKGNTHELIGKGWKASSIERVWN